MMPGGHLATSLALSGVAYAATGSIEASAGCFAGGFLIVVDHYLDYLFFERQWRKPSPVQFLRYYFSYSPKKLVLPLHSAELMSFLFLIVLAHPWPLLVGYWVGALMHLTFDVLVNGEHALRRPVLFYVFGYRIAKRFDAAELMKASTDAKAGLAPIRDFFRWRPAQDDPVREPIPGAPEIQMPATQRRSTSA
jgi:uncharacterized membrane protein